MCGVEYLAKGGVHWTRKMLEVYVGMDDQERSLWERLTERGVHGTGRPIEVMM
jgi:hypothetical protein